MSAHPPIRILIADDHPVVRDGLSAMLSTQPDFEVVAQAASGRQALDQIVALQPDIVLLDLEMPEMDGVAVLQALQDAQAQAAVIVFTAYDTDERILEAVRAGARGYLLKGARREQLFEAIRSVSAGDSLLGPAVAHKLMQRVAREAIEAPLESLSPRELQVLRELSQGKSNAEIAASLFISERTVKFHVSAILRKLGAANRTEAAKIAAQRGLVDW
ncbi:MAG: response regulator transcription factor [Chloroflexota bacterium]